MLNTTPQTLFNKSLDYENGKKTRTATKNRILTKRLLPKMKKKPGTD